VTRLHRRWGVNEAEISFQISALAGLNPGPRSLMAANVTTLLQLTPKLVPPLSTYIVPMLEVLAAQLLVKENSFITLFNNYSMQFL